MELKPWHKNVLSMLAIAVIGFILFNVAFLLAAIVMGGVSSFIGTQGGPPYVGRIMYLVVILLISWFVFTSRLSDLAKATYLIMPLMVFLIMEGMLLNEQPQLIILAVGAVMVGAVLYYLHQKKRSWLYYFATFYVTVVALCVMIFQVEI
jgi:hypothetical protein